MLFKKSKKANKDNNATADNIEFIDLDNSDKTDVTDKIDKKINYKVILICVILVIVFVFLLPTITSIFDKSSPENYTNTVNNNSSNNLVNGFIQIDKNDSNMTVNDVRFYNFTKRSNNLISYNYKAEKAIKNTLSLKLYIEIYNRSETIIYREVFNPSTEIEKGPVLSSSITLNPNLYKEAYYVKIVEITSENAIVTNSINCTKEFTDGIFNLKYSVKYNFGENALLSYEVTKNAIISQTEDNEESTSEDTDLEKYNDIFLQEEADVSNTNATEYQRDNNYLKYTIDLRTIDLQDSNYKLLYNIGTVERTVKVIEESNGWSCSNE